MTGRRRVLAHLVALAALCASLLIVLDPPYADNFVLFGDAIWIPVVFKNLLFGLPFESPQLAWPLGYHAPQYPITNLVTLAVAKLVALAVEDPVRVYVVMIRLLVLMNAAAAFYALRRLNCPLVMSVACAALFASSEFVLTRIGTHFFVADVFAIPLAVLLAAWVLRTVSLGRLEVVLCCFVVGLSNFYFAFFGCGLVALAGIVAALGPDRRAAALAATTAIVLTASLFFLQVAGHASFFDADVSLPSRQVAEQAMYGLRFIDAFVPRNNATRWIFDHYTAAVRPKVEGTEFIGYLALAGVLLAVLSLLSRIPASRRADVAPQSGDADLRAFLGFLTCFTVVFALPFGSGMLFAYLGATEVRAQNRLSIFIVFFGLLAVALLMKELNGRRAVAGLALVAALTLGDVISRWHYFPAGECGDHCWAKAQAVRSELAPVLAAMETRNIRHVLQLPVHPFAEAGPRGRRSDYFGFYPYLMTAADSPLRFSHGMTRQDALTERLQQIESRLGAAEADIGGSLRCIGYDGVLVDRLAYELDRLGTVEAALGEAGAELAAASQSYSLYRLPAPGDPVDPSKSRSERMDKAVGCTLPVIEPGRGYSFPGGNLSPLILISGWHPPEAGGVWSQRQVSRLGMRLAGAGQRARVALRIAGLLGGGLTDRTARITPGSQPAIDIRFSKEAPVAELQLDIEPRPDGVVTIQIESDFVTSPEDIGLNSDARRLGVMLANITVSSQAP